METLSKAFYLRCEQSEKSILERVQSEIEFNVDNYDSGPGVEDIIRDTLSELLPRRYCIAAGSINDCMGRTSGDSEIVVFNDIWFPKVKSGATPNSRRCCFPIEGVYANIEVKQTLSEKTLDLASEKLVSSNRLFRPSISNDYVTENRVFGAPTPFLANPLFTAIIATRREKSFSINDAITRFIRINQKLKRTEMIQFLCVLGEFACFWGYASEKGQMRPATFQGEDLESTLYAAIAKKSSKQCPLYYLISQLYAHCERSILTPQSLEVAYGIGTNSLPFAANQELQIQPTNEHFDCLALPVLSQYIAVKEGNRT